MASFVRHFKAIGEFKLELQSGNAKIESKWVIFSPCDVKIWQMTLKNNRAPLLCYLKLCVSFHSHLSIQSGVTVRKRQIWVKIGDFYTPAQRSWGGVYWIHLVRPSVRLSVCPSACWWWSYAGAYWFSAMSLSKWLPGGHIVFLGFRTLTLLWLWISTPNFSGTILMYIGRSPSIFSYVIFKMATWQPYWIFQFLDSVGGMVSGA